MRKRCLIIVLTLTLFGSYAFASQEKELFEKGVRLLKENQFLEAVDTFSALLELAPDNPDAYKNRGVAYMKLNQYDLAIHDFEKTREIVPDLKGLYSNLGVAWYYKSDYPKAIENYDKEISISPESHYAFFNRAICWAELKEYDKSLSDIRKTLELSPKFYLAHCLKGDLYLKMGEPNKARMAYQDAVTVDPKQEYARTKLDELGPAPVTADKPAPQAEPEKTVAAKPAPKKTVAANTGKQKPDASARPAAPKPAAPKKAAANTAPAAKPEVKPQPPARKSDPGPTDGYALQTGAFRQPGNADAMIGRLKKKGQAPRLLVLTRPSQITWYLVRIGHYNDKAAALAAGVTFKKATGMEAIARPAGRF